MGKKVISDALINILILIFLFNYWFKITKSYYLALLSIECWIEFNFS